jgi:hypothetical protein
MIKGLLTVAVAVCAGAVVIAPASAQQCNGFFLFPCANEPAANVAANGSQPAEARHPVAGAAVRPDQQAQQQPARSARVARARRTAHKRYVRNEEWRGPRMESRQEASACTPLKDEEKAALFRDILKWQSEQRASAGPADGAGSTSQ